MNSGPGKIQYLSILCCGNCHYGAMGVMGASEVINGPINFRKNTIIFAWFLGQYYKLTSYMRPHNHNHPPPRTV